MEERISIVGRIKGLLALHGIWLSGKRVGKGLRERLDTMRTGDGRPLAPFLRREIERMLRHYDFVSQQIEDVVADRKGANSDMLAPTTLEAMLSRRNELEIAIVPDQGHAPLLTEPKLVRRIAAFVASCDVSTRS